MHELEMKMVDGNYAASTIAYLFSELAAIYPITPSSPMGENADEWASNGERNIFGQRVEVIEMQSEAGAAGTVHGALCAGALCSTFTASQGLLLMLPDMHKIAGELLPTVFHVASRSIASHSLSIFGDHSDVMSARNTGFAMINSANPQEALDIALVSHLASLKASLPFLHFFDGFRTSHEIQKVQWIARQALEEHFTSHYMEHLQRFRQRALRPESPEVRIAAQNPEVFFQASERRNPYYEELPQLLQGCMDEIAQLTGRQYQLFEYTGADDATEVVVAMGSACDTLKQTVAYLNQQGKRVGCLHVRCYRPFDGQAFAAALPRSVKGIAVLDRCKEAGSSGEPLYLDVLSAAHRQHLHIEIIGGRYGLSSKEFTPAHACTVFEYLAGGGQHNFSIGIEDDISHRSLAVPAEFQEIDLTPKNTISALFWGLGSDGTVGANKNSVKIIGEQTELKAQAYFVYDSRKAFGLTVSHLRFGQDALLQPYEIYHADFIACHHPSYPQRYELLKPLKQGATFLLNTNLSPIEAFYSLKDDDQQIILQREIAFYVIDASHLALKLGIKSRINTIMQAAFFHLSGVIDADRAIRLIKQSIAETYGVKGQAIVESNYRAVDSAIAALQLFDSKQLTARPNDEQQRLLRESQAAPMHPQFAKSGFAKDVIAPILRFQGNQIPVSALSPDGTMPQGSARLEKRRMALEVPRWLPENCIQCNLCVMTCPHSVIRAKQIAPTKLESKPEKFTTIRSNTINGRDLEFRIQIFVDDCTGCGVCIDVCPAKNKALEYSPIETEISEGEVSHYQFFDKLPEDVLDGTKLNTPKGVSFKKPYFEFHSACAGCGETPYYNLVTKLYGSRMIVANATGCSSIYAGTYPTTPFVKDSKGRGVAWGNSLFEDNAEYALGMRLAVDRKRENLHSLSTELLSKMAGRSEFVALAELLQEAVDCFDDTSEEAYDRQLEIHRSVRVFLEEGSEKNVSLELRSLLGQLQSLTDYFVDKSVWAIGGDGWAYDIGFGGLDHVLSLPHNVNVLVLDTEVYSNTGGQSSKATPVGSIAKFAERGKRNGKKNLGMMMMQYGHVYVATVSMGANRAQVIRAFMEAEAHPGPSLILAYSPCIAHGIDMMKMQQQEKLATETGYFPLFRYNPLNPKGERLSRDSRQTKRDVTEFLQSERRYANLLRSMPELAEELFEQEREQVNNTLAQLEHWKSML